VQSQGSNPEFEMSVIRINHQKNYVVINKDVLENKALSFKAKGLWTYCMSRPNDWTFHVSHLATVSKDKEDAVYSAIKELEKEGYVRKIQKSEKGRFGPVDYEISEIKIILPLAGFPDAVFPDAENPALLNNDLNQIKKENPPLPPPRDPAPPMTKQDWRRRISPNWKDEEFNFAWDKLEKSKNRVVRIQEWLEATMKSFRDSNIFGKNSQEVILKHRIQAFAWDGLTHRGDRVTALNDRIEFTCGSYYKAVEYSVSDEEWERETGWKNER